MPRVPLFVRSARRARRRRTPLDKLLAYLLRWPAGAALLLAAIVSLSWLWLAASRPAVLVDPIAIDERFPLATDEANARLHRDLTALRDRARRSDALALPSDGDWPLAEAASPDSTLTHVGRWMRRAMGREGRRVSIQIAVQPAHYDVTVRDTPSSTSLHARVAGGPLAAERVLTRASEMALLMTAPAAAASLALDDPRTIVDASRRDQLLTIALRDATAANDPRVALVRGIDAAASGRCEHALSLYASVIASHPDAPQAYVLAADCDIQLGERERALARLRQTPQGADASSLALSLAGQAYQRVGHAEQGLTMMRAAHARDPELATNAVAIGEALLALHRPAEALAWLEPRRPDPTVEARWLGALGVAQVRTGAGPAAEATASRLRAIDASSAEATRIEAELAAAAKAWPRALGRFGALRLATPHDASAYAGEGRALLGLGRPVDAVAAYRRCAELAPWSAECRLGLATALREADDPEAALPVLAEAAELDALDPRIPSETARTLRSLLRRDEAAVHTAHAEALGRQLEQRLPLP